jgi:hypothetical protein
MKGPIAPQPAAGAPSRPAKPDLNARRPGGAPAPEAAGQGARRSTAAIVQALDQLEHDIRLLRIEFEKFFAGALPVPPEEMRTRVQGSIRNLRNLSFSSFAENFRLADLEARFNSYSELFNRRLRDQEEGRHRAARQAALAAPRAYDAARGVVFGDAFEPAAVAALYEGLAKGPGDGPRFDLESFRSYLSKQVSAIRAKTGCAEVQFRISEEDGKLKLKARPL